MRYKFFLTTLLMFIPGFLLIFQPCLSANEDKADSQKNFLFSNLKRPVPGFDHTKHETSLSNKGCGICHHVLDTVQNKPVYAEGEEAACSQCHLKVSADNLPALREASHKSCTGCHRSLKKEKKPAGPTTCGECHRN